jgi:hypothetical protein
MPLKPVGLAAALVTCGAMTAPVPGQPLTGQNDIIASHGPWRAVVAESHRGRVCYAAGSPQSREPEGVVRGRGFLFVTTRPGDRVRDEVSVEFGFDLAGQPLVAIGDRLFAFAIEGQTAWIRQASEEARMVAAMRKAGQLTIRSVSALGEATVDTYSLVGFGPALDAARRACAAEGS